MITLSIGWESGYRWAASVERKALNPAEQFASKFVLLLHYSSLFGGKGWGGGLHFETGFQLLPSNLQQAICGVHQLEEVSTAQALWKEKTMETCL